MVNPISSESHRFVSATPGYWPDVSSTDWADWRWQLKNRVTSLSALEQRLNLNTEERAGVLLAGSKLALAVTPHYFNLIERDNPGCPIRRQVIPRIEEGYDSPFDMADPCGEDTSMPVPGLVHRYPDRVLFLVTDRCASYCRYCTRSRVVSGVGEQELVTDFEEAFRYLEKHTEVRDVLLSGGDALLLSDSKLEGILQRLRSIPHIEFLRIGTRVPIFLPQRITPELCAMLRKYHPLWMSVHVNHPRELTVEVRDALGLPADLPLLVADAGDADALRRLVGSARAVITTVGPYQLHGEASRTSASFVALRPAMAFWKWVLAFALLEMAGPWLLLGHAETRVSSSFAGLMLATVPLVGVLIAGLRMINRPRI